MAGGADPQLRRSHPGLHAGRASTERGKQGSGSEWWRGGLPDRTTTFARLIRRPVRSQQRLGGSEPGGTWVIRSLQRQPAGCTGRRRINCPSLGFFGADASFSRCARPSASGDGPSAASSRRSRSVAATERNRPAASTGLRSESLAAPSLPLPAGLPQSTRQAVRRGMPRSPVRPGCPRSPHWRAERRRRNRPGLAECVGGPSRKNAGALPKQSAEITAGSGGVEDLPGLRFARTALPTVADRGGGAGRQGPPVLLSNSLAAGPQRLGAGMAVAARQ